MRVKLSAFSYVEVLVAMVIISGVFTAFINLAYSAVHRAKILEAKDLMENYAYSLLERFGEALAATSTTQGGQSIWNTSGNFFIDKLPSPGKEPKEVLSSTNCKLSKDSKYLEGECAMAKDVLNNANDKFGYFFHTELVSPGKVIKVTAVLGCVQKGDQRITCRGDELPPVKIVKFFTNYGQAK